METQSSSPPLNMPHPPQSSEIQPFPLPVLPRPDIPVGGRLAHCGTMGRIDRQQMGPLYRSKWFQDTIPVNSSSFGSSDKSESIFPLLLQEEIVQLLQKWEVKRVQNLGTPGFYFWLFLVPKKNGKLCPVIDLSILNQYIRKQPFKMETVKSILVNDWGVSIDLTDAYLHVPIHPRSRKSSVYEHQVFQFTVLPFGMSLSPWIFTKLMDVIVVHLHQCAIPLSVSR